MRGRIRAQSLSNCFQHAVHIAHDVVIPEAQNSIIACTQPLIAHMITLASSVLAAIDLYDQSPFATNKVNDVSADRMPANEFMAIDRTRS